MLFFQKLRWYASLLVLSCLLFPVLNFCTGWWAPDPESGNSAPAPERKIAPTRDREIAGLTITYFPVQNATPADIISFFSDPRGGRRHEGVDIRAERGRPVLAVLPGTVDKVKTGGAGGKQIWLNVEGRELQLYYAHLDRQLVQEGQRVRAGQVIGTVGNTGNASHTTPHLHFCIYRPGRDPVDPLPYLSKPRP